MSGAGRKGFDVFSLLGSLLNAGLVLLALWIVGVIAWAMFDHIDWQRDNFPNSIKLSGVLASDQEGAIREGCVQAVLKIDPNSSERIGREGLSFLTSQRRARNGVRLAEWLPTPVKTTTREGLEASRTSDGDYLYGEAGITCQMIDEGYRKQASEALHTPGNFYTSFNGGEGLLILVPRDRLAFYFYFG